MKVLGEILPICGVYSIECLSNGKIYIGQSVNIKKRCREHIGLLKLGKHENSHLQRAYNKYGTDNFLFVPIRYCDTVEDSLNLEEKIIKEKNLTESDNGFNQTNGGEGSPMLGRHHTLETRQKMSEAQKGNKKWLGKNHSEESKQKISKAKTGNKNRLGKHHSEETKQKMSEAAKNRSEETRKKISESLRGNKNSLGYKHSEESKQKIAEAQKGRLISKETRQKLSETTKGENNPNYGKHPSEETRQKMSDAKKGKNLSEEHKQNLSKAHKGKVKSEKTRQKISESKRGKPFSEETKQNMSKFYEIIYPDGSTLIVKGLKQFCQNNMLSYQPMIEGSQGRQKSHKGYKCRKIEE